ncbi:Transmembrane protein 62 [Bulinus truncatus]|nr:Transmembrane protein 62 [Bulinus truncatus]
MRNVFWFVQISDIHISKFRDLARGPDLQRFCEEYISVINPNLVIVTGDLTDGKTETGIESMQVQEEWIQYENLVKRCSSFSKAKWLDLRGNHDSFDVLNDESENNYYRFLSARRQDARTLGQRKDAYIYQLQLPFGVYSFVGIDTCSKPGLHRPFNFFGFLNKPQIEHLKTIASITKSSNQTIWFGHFPTSLIVHSPPVLRQIMSTSIAYLCGHLHTLFGYCPNMYSRHKTGQLELELGDWKENRIFRVLAVDHDILSFTDAKLGDWPLVIISNPKSNKLYSPVYEPLHLIKTSTHIRLLIFSPSPIKQIVVYIDRHVEGEAFQVWHGYPLYVLEWHPEQYGYGLHYMQVFVLDEAGRNTTVSQTFSVDLTASGFDLLPRMILMLNIYTLGKLIFGLCIFCYCLILTCFRQCTSIYYYFLPGHELQIVAFNSCLLKLWLVARTDVSFYLLVGSVLYLGFGPWFVGRLLTDHLGVVFVWGIFIHGTFIPGALTYFYGIFQFVTFSLPLTIIMGVLLDNRRKYAAKTGVLKYPLVLIPTVLFFIFTVRLAISEFPSAYGIEAFFFGPLRTGNIFLLLAGLWLGSRADLRKVTVSESTL